MTPTSDFWQPRRLGHANLFIGDYERAADYYRDVVGLHEVYRQPDNMATFVSNGNTYHDLGLTDLRSRYAKKGQPAGLWHYAFEVETEVDLVAGYRRALDAGVKFQFTEDHDVAHSLYLLDPDGMLIEIYADVVKDWRSARHGIIIKEKPKYIPGVTSAPNAERNYPLDPQIERVEHAVFHSKRCSHVAVVSSKYEEMLDFYTRIVGLGRIFANENHAVLRGSYAGCALTLYRERSGLAAGLHHVGFEVWGEDDLEQGLLKAHGKGIRVEREVEHAARRSVCILDPDGIRLQFYVNRNWTPEAVATVSDDAALYLL
jgi:catechol 2,3-dioxygenase